MASSAPGKLILFGEHAVVFGEPALALAIDLRTHITATPAPAPLLNTEPLGEGAYPYVDAVLRRHRSLGSLALTVDTEIPEGAGMGSSAAVTVSLLACLHFLQGPFEAEDLAREGFEVEHEVQGRASPIDTTTATQGGGILLLKQPGENLLWTVERGETAWHLHACELPPLSLVVGSTGIEAATGPLVAQVKGLVARQPEARAAIRRIGEITLAGLEALRGDDLDRVGALMGENHALLNELGVGHPLLDRFVEVSLPHAYGAKLTGAGGGGSMMALTEDPEAVSQAIEAEGGSAFVVRTEAKGVEVHESG